MPKGLPHPPIRPRVRLVGAQDRRRTLVRFVAFLALMVALHTTAMVTLEGMEPGNALWLTLTTMTTVGYGDYAAATPLGRAATVVLLYVGGIFVLFEAAATYFEYRAERRVLMRKGQWRWRMKDHILVLNAPAANPEQYLCRLLSEFRRSRRLRLLPVLIVTEAFPDGLPQALLDFGAVHVHGSPGEPGVLRAAGAAVARYVVILAHDEMDRSSDVHAFDVLHRLGESGAKGLRLAECVNDSDRPRLRAAGADILVRPMRGYPEMIVRALVAPGAEDILEDLFTSRGDECWRYDVSVRGVPWAEVVSQLVRHDIGVPIAYRSRPDGVTRCNPPPGTPVDADKIFVLVREGNSRPDDDVARLIARLPRV